MVEHRRSEHEAATTCGLEEGMLMTVVMPDGRTLTDYVTDVQRDKATGEERVIVGRDPLPRAMAMMQRVTELTTPANPRWWRRFLARLRRWR
ncbi:hypothetical protein H7J86_24455 [Mycobacterium hackensackense]|uniref:hypothetical protein n=1 Tax=Mycobacterium hackensackense TaxID=228909 RepID=UPI002265E140|nr:hypothetical protein [Mycobacterium hackensackense]MCV7255320.1 hypothetical protein [Mycobacterium hackensackense]